MKCFFKRFFLVVCILSALTSCRKEEIISINPTDDETLEPNSNLADLIQRTTTQDGSIDNILDKANCFTIKLPITVTANSTEISVSSISDYELVEDVFDEYIEDTDHLNLSFPFTIILSDFSERVVNDYTELNNYAQDCNGENTPDYDIECIDFVYPISASSFNTVSELTDRHSFSNDHDLFAFITHISATDIVDLDFPMTLNLHDGSQIEVNSISELETSIINAQDLCHEDDDYDYDDDDCNHCTQELLTDYLTGCSDWLVNKLRRDSTNYDDLYEDYDFNFFIDNTVSALWSGITVYGTWEVSGNANDMILTIDIPSLPPCNNSWHLQEIDEDNDNTKIDLRLSDANRLRYQNPCN